MIREIKAYLEKELFESSHDIEHSYRVAQNAEILAARREDVDMEVLKISALLHDIAKAREDRDASHQTDHCVEGVKMASDLLRKLNYPEAKLEKVCQAIRYHREFQPDVPLCIEAMLIYDAGILENLGAIGIARTYMIAGEFQEKLYNPEPLAAYIQKNVNISTGKVMDFSIHAPNLEFDLNWADADRRLYTPEAKKTARERIAFSKMFFRTLHNEWYGKGEERIVKS